MPRLDPPTVRHLVAKRLVVGVPVLCHFHSSLGLCHAQKAPERLQDTFARCSPPPCPGACRTPHASANVSGRWCHAQPPASTVAGAGILVAGSRATQSRSLSPSSAFCSSTRACRPTVGCALPDCMCMCMVHGGACTSNVALASEHRAARAEQHFVVPRCAAQLLVAAKPTTLARTGTNS